MAMIDESTNSARLQSRHLITVLSRKKEKKKKRQVWWTLSRTNVSLQSTISYNNDIYSWYVRNFIILSSELCA